MDAISPSILLLLNVGETISYSSDCLGVGNSTVPGDLGDVALYPATAADNAAAASAGARIVLPVEPLE